jgi:hypothetical protein
MTGGEDRCQVSDLSGFVEFSGKNSAFLRRWRVGSPRLLIGTSPQLGEFLPGLLEDVSAGLGINKRGEVVGNSIAPPGLPTGNPQIAGLGVTGSGEVHAYLATPDPPVN